MSKIDLSVHGFLIHTVNGGYHGQSIPSSSGGSPVSELSLPRAEKRGERERVLSLLAPEFNAYIARGSRESSGTGLIYIASPGSSIAFIDCEYSEITSNVNYLFPCKHCMAVMARHVCTFNQYGGKSANWSIIVKTKLAADTNARKASPIFQSLWDHANNTKY